MISVEENISQFERGLSDMASRQLPFATALALNDTAKDVHEAWLTQLERRLDRPTPFTKRGIYTRRATKAKLFAQVGFKDQQAKYLAPLVKGGTRLPRGRAILIPVQQRLNKYGNMPRGAVARAVSGGKTFSGKVNGVAGLYKRPTGKRRKGKAPKLLVAYADRAQYRAMLDLQKPAQGRARQEFPAHFVRRFKAALAS